MQQHLEILVLYPLSVFSDYYRINGTNHLDADSVDDSFMAMYILLRISLISSLKCKYK